MEVTLSSFWQRTLLSSSLRSWVFPPCNNVGVEVAVVVLEGTKASAGGDISLWALRSRVSTVIEGLIGICKLYVTSKRRRQKDGE